MNDRVSVFDGDGRFLAQWTGLDRADAVAVHGDFVYVGTGREKRLIRFSLDGRNLGDAVPAASLGYTHGIYLDRGGNLYVADPIADDAHKPPIKAAARGR